MYTDLVLPRRTSRCYLNGGQPYGQWNCKSGKSHRTVLLTSYEGNHLLRRLFLFLAENHNLLYHFFQLTTDSIWNQVGDSHWKKLSTRLQRHPKAFNCSDDSVHSSKNKNELMKTSTKAYFKKPLSDSTTFMRRNLLITQSDGMVSIKAALVITTMMRTVISHHRRVKTCHNNDRQQFRTTYLSSSCGALCSSLGSTISCWVLPSVGRLTFLCQFNTYQNCIIN